MLLYRAREALSCCLQHLTVYLPNDLLDILQLTLMDSVGFDDANPVRALRQHMLEKTADHMVLLLDRGLESSESVARHLKESSFIEGYVLDHTSDDPPDRPLPKLSVIIFRWGRTALVLFCSVLFCPCAHAPMRPCCTGRRARTRPRVPWDSAATR